MSLWARFGFGSAIVPAEDDGRGSVLGRLRRGGGGGGGGGTAATSPGPDSDSVTGLPSREHLFDWVTESIERSRPSSSHAVVCFVDIGLLRDVNDSFGPDAGDALLRGVADRLRSIDLPNTRSLRYEGAEFAVVFEHIAHYEQAEEVARFLVELLSPEFEIGTDRITITPYIGAAVSADNYSQVEDFIRDAHRALARARDEGPGGWAVHDESKRGRYDTRVDEERLREALANEEFVLQYQPIVRLDTQQIIGAEALLRWKAPGATNVGLLFPHDFMPMLEKTGLVVPVGEWVISEACRQTAEWNAMFPNRPAMFITVNVGARQLASTGFRDETMAAVERAGIQTWQLCLDITEGALRFNRNAAWAALRDLKNLGVKLGLDDFGTGVSSLLYLREFRLDIVRIDRVFVESLHHETNKEDRAIIRHISGLAHDLGLVAIAEGVENNEQATILRKLGVDLAQGFHFGRPASARQFNGLVDPSLATPNTWDPSEVLDFESGR